MKVVVIGSGPGGYVAAIRCAQLGFQVSLIERYPNLGGTCLNVGCIPSKALLDSSEHFHFLNKSAGEHGISIQELKVDWEKMQLRKQDVVDQNTKGISYLMKKNGIELIQGHASFTNDRKLSVLKSDGTSLNVEFEKCIIATGSKPILPEQFNCNKDRIISSTEALQLKEIPHRMAIIGAGVIGLELGSVYARLGTQVDIIEYQDGILPGMDRDCVKELQKSLQRLGMKFFTGHSVETVIQEGQKVFLNIVKNSGEKNFRSEVDYCLVAIGRKPYTENLQLEKAGVACHANGRIITDSAKQTHREGIFAIGDVTEGPMLAHKAEEEGVLVAEYLAGQKPHLNEQLIPGVVYTWPELASVGKTEEQLQREGIPFKIGKFPYKALGRARASGELEGIVKLIAHAESDEILGAHMVGARAADLIMEIAVAMEFRAAAEDIARICHPHPTYSEAIKEAALDGFQKMSLHS